MCVDGEADARECVNSKDIWSDQPRYVNLYTYVHAKRQGETKTQGIHYNLFYAFSCVSEQWALEVPLTSEVPFEIGTDSFLRTCVCACVCCTSSLVDVHVIVLRAFSQEVIVNLAGPVGAAHASAEPCVCFQDGSRRC